MAGQTADGTAFSKDKRSVEDIGEYLRQSGMSPTGDETFYNAQTGQRMKSQVFNGICYYQRTETHGSG